jgi:hypothetical protein
MEDDDDKPISTLIAAKKSDSVKNMEDDDDKPISALIAAKKNTPTKDVAAKPETSSTSSSLNNGAVSDSDDDLPIIEFVKKRDLEKQAYKLSLEKKTKLENGKKSSSGKSSNKNSNESKGSNGKSTLEGNSSSSSSWNSDSLESIFYSQTEKGRLIQSFLRRWWYSYEWPALDKLGEAPKGYEPLDGFPGVYVSTRVS